jgi:D-alanyl-D-alanine carboxypeptidase/D-alanyl-D-alanine-endopeptidase (penicillin-binding protein 4)
VNGHAGLADLAAATAQALRLAGTVEVSLGLDDSLFSGPALHPRWRASYIASGYVAPVAALAVDIGRTRDEFYAPRYADPAMHAAGVFADLLTAEGIAVTGPTRSSGTGGSQLAAVESAPMREIVRLTVQQSDNTLAEVLGRLVAIARGLPGSFSGATAAVVAEAAAQGIDTSDVVISDCSGLADGSQIPARTLVEELLLASRPGNVDLLPVVLDLPISGWQGTLAGRFGEGPARGLVRAKTGSLPGVTSLAGTLQTQAGRLLVFAVMADGTPPGGQLRPQVAIDEFCQRLAGLA